MTKQHVETSCQHLVFLIILGQPNHNQTSCPSRHENGQTTELNHHIRNTTNDLLLLALHSSNPNQTKTLYCIWKLYRNDLYIHGH